MAVGFHFSNCELVLLRAHPQTGSDMGLEVSGFADAWLDDI
jgi:hypothetical protein